MGGLIQAAVRRVTEGIGAVAEAEQQAAMEQAEAGRAPPSDAGEAPPTALLVEVDGSRSRSSGAGTR